MIDIKKIERAAENFAGRYFGLSRTLYGGTRCFIGGINYFLDNLWHSGKKKPQKDGDLLVIFYKDKKRFYGLRHAKDLQLPDSGIECYLYIDDLFK